MTKGSNKNGARMKDNGAMKDTADNVVGARNFVCQCNQAAMCVPERGRNFQKIA